MDTLLRPQVTVNGQTMSYSDFEGLMWTVIVQSLEANPSSHAHQAATILKAMDGTNRREFLQGITNRLDRDNE